MLGLSEFHERIYALQKTVIDSKPNYQLKSDLIFDGSSIKIKMKLTYLHFNCEGMPMQGKIFKLKLKKSNMPELLLELEENVINVFYSYFEPKHHYQVCEDGRIRFQYKNVGNRKQIVKHVQVQMEYKRDISEIQSLRFCLQKQRYEHQIYKRQVQREAQNKKQTKQQPKQIEQKNSECFQRQIKMVKDQKAEQGGKSASAIQKSKSKMETKIKKQQKRSQNESANEDILIQLQNDIYGQHENESKNENGNENENENENKKQKNSIKMMKYEYKEQGNILFKQKATKFKVNNNQLDMFVEINVVQDLKKKLYWVHVKNQAVFTHKHAGLLVKGRSEIKKFGGKQQNVVLSVYAMQNKKPQQLIFKIQFEDNKQSDKFIEVVKNIIGKCKQ